MKGRITAALAALALAAAAAPAMAQGGMGNMGGMGGPPNPAMMAQRMSDRMLQGITLSAAQTDSVKAINARFSEAMTTAMQSANGDRAAMREKMAPMRDQHRAQLRAILTADQQAVFDKNMAEMEKMRANRGAPTP